MTAERTPLADDSALFDLPLFTEDELKAVSARAVAYERARIVAWLRDTGDQHSLVYQAGMTVTQAADRLAEEAPA